MPSKEDLLFITAHHHHPHPHDEMKGNTTQDFLARDVDDLVAEIKENLRLRSRPCHSIYKNRASPYKVPNRTIGESKCHSCGSPRCMRTCLKKPQADSSDPYELLQMLLREGSLIKEAVKRLQEPAPKATKKSDKLFYDDCDSHTPIPVHLELEV